MSDTLEWHAKRGLSAASDEPEEQNMRRLAGPLELPSWPWRPGAAEIWLYPMPRARLRRPVARTRHRRSKMASNRAKLGASCCAVCRQDHERLAVKVCIEDQPVGKVHMERLRCGLDVDIK